MMRAIKLKGAQHERHTQGMGRRGSGEDGNKNEQQLLCCQGFALKNETLTVKNSGNEFDQHLRAGFKRLGLTSREIQILRQLALGRVDKQISIDLMISVKTVNHHVSKIMLKLEATNRTHAVVKALLTKQIEMRTNDTPDTPVGILNRRMGEMSKTVQATSSNNIAGNTGCAASERPSQPEPSQSTEAFNKSPL